LATLIVLGIFRQYCPSLSFVYQPTDSGQQAKAEDQRAAIRLVNLSKQLGSVAS
jgi:hypothetical protein